MSTSLPILLIAVLGLFGLGFNRGDQLDKLEKLARSYPVHETRTEVTTDDLMYWQCQALINIVRQDLGASITFTNIDLPVVGMTTIDSRAIQVQERLHWTARFETLAHEAAHLLCPDELEGHGDREVCAESVAMLVVTQAGDKDGLYRSAHYLSSLKGSLHIIQDYRQEITRAARILSTR